MNQLLMKLIVITSISCQGDLDYTDRKNNTTDAETADASTSSERIGSKQSENSTENTTNTSDQESNTASDEANSNDISGEFDFDFNEDTDGDGYPDNLDTDDDNDGINDSDEIAIGLDPLDVDSDDNGTNDGEEDSDSDGISNADESDENSPNITDSDNDGNADIVDQFDTDSDGSVNDLDDDDDGDGVSDSDEVIIGTNPLLADSDNDGVADGDGDFDGDGVKNSDDTDHNTGPPEGFTLVSGTLRNDLLGGYPAEVSYDISLEKGCTFSYVTTQRIGHRFYTVADGTNVDSEYLANQTHSYTLFMHYGNHDHDGNTTAARSEFKTKGFNLYRTNGVSNIDWDITTGTEITWIFDHDGFLKGYQDDILRARSQTTIADTSKLHLTFANGSGADSHTYPTSVTKTCLDFRLTSPNGSGSNTVGDVKNISWESFGTATHVKLSYSYDWHSNDMNVITESTENDGSYAWVIPDFPSSTVKVKVEAADDSSQYDKSDFFFVIQNPPDEDLDGIPDATDTDDDNDGINDSDEALLGTNPFDSDSDGNGISDGAEDADNDGISNANESDETSSTPTDNDGDGNYDVEFSADTDGDSYPNDIDNDDDNDGINDSDEALIGTDPLLADSDSNGTQDGLDDFDADGLNNAAESDSSSQTATDIDADGNPDITTFTNNAISGFTHVDGTPDMIDSDTLDADSAVTYDTTLEAGTRLIVSKEWVEAVALPAISSDTGKKVLLGVKETSSDLSDGFVISEFAFHINWERDPDSSVSGYIAKLEDEKATEEYNTGTIHSLTDSPYDYAIEYDGTNIYLIMDDLGRLETEPSVANGGSFSHTKQMWENTEAAVTKPLEIIITANTTVDITASGLSKINIPVSDDIDGDGILDVIDLDTNDGPFGDLDQDGVANNVDLDNTDGPKMSSGFVYQFGSTTTDTFSDLAAMSDGSILMTGKSLKNWGFTTVVEPFDYSEDVFITKFNPTTQTVEWVTFLGSGPGESQDYSRAIAVDGNDDFIVVGSVGGSLAHRGAISLEGNGYVAKYNSSGELQWVTHEGAPGGSGNVYGVATDANNNVYAGVLSSGNSVNGVSQKGGLDIYLVKYSPTGDVIWTKKFGGNGNETLSAMVISDDKIYLCGYTDGSIGSQSNNGEEDFLVAKYNLDGTRDWFKIFGSDGADYLNDIDVDAKGSIYVTGYTGGSYASSNAGGNDTVTIKLDTDGNEIWATQKGTSREDWAQAITVSHDNKRVYVTGNSLGNFGGNGFNDNEGNYFLKVLDSAGNENSASSYGTTTWDYGRKVLDLGDQGIFVAGATFGQIGVSPHNGAYDLFIHKFVDDKVDTDGDGTTNFLDTDDDNDGINDADELLIGTDTSLQDTNGDGTADGAGDFDGDGIDNATESNASLGTQTDIDGDSNPDIITP